MQEIRCPHCGEVFQVDEAGYAAIVKQVRDKEFTREIELRERTAVQLAVAESEKKKDQELNDLHIKLEKLKQDYQATQERMELENQMMLQKERQTIMQLKGELEAQQEKLHAAVQIAVQEQELKIKELQNDLQHEKDDRTCPCAGHGLRAGRLRRQHRRHL